MNAKEFAHELEKAASFIRQQQAEIEALKAAKIRAYNNGVEDGRKPDTNNEPVAYGMLTFCKNCGEQNPYAVKELTEKQKWLTEIDVKQQALKKIIDWLILEHDTLACTSYPLRKAQEK